MKNIQLISFFISIILATGLMSMEKKLQELPERASQVLGEDALPHLPPDIQRMILTKLLRLILDELENDPQLLLSRERVDVYRGILGKYFNNKSSIERYQSDNNIDFIITLIAAGADPNIKNYKGNNVLHLLIKAIQKPSDFEKLKLRIKMLCGYGININAKNGNGDTIAHQIIDLCLYDEKSTLQQTCTYIIPFLKFLIPLGLNMFIKSGRDQLSALEMGQNEFEYKISIMHDILLMQDLLYGWMEILLLMDKNTKNYYGNSLWQAFEERIQQIDPDLFDSPIFIILQRDYSNFRAKE
jgi:hypothetical protein